MIEVGPNSQRSSQRRSVDSAVKLLGPFRIKSGPNPRIVCKWCAKHVAVRSVDDDVLSYLICTRPNCMQSRPANEYANEIAAQIMIYGAQLDGNALKFEDVK
jgi:hypothetical protein